MRDAHPAAKATGTPRRANPRKRLSRVAPAFRAGGRNPKGPRPRSFLGSPGPLKDPDERNTTESPARCGLRLAGGEERRPACSNPQRGPWRARPGRARSGAPRGREVPRVAPLGGLPSNDPTPRKKFAQETNPFDRLAELCLALTELRDPHAHSQRDYDTAVNAPTPAQAERANLRPLDAWRNLK